MKLMTDTHMFDLYDDRCSLFVERVYNVQTGKDGYFVIVACLSKQYVIDRFCGFSDHWHEHEAARAAVIHLIMRHGTKMGLSIEGA